MVSSDETGSDNSTGEGEGLRTRRQKPGVLDDRLLQEWRHRKKVYVGLEGKMDFKT